MFLALAGSIIAIWKLHPGPRGIQILFLAWALASSFVIGIRMRRKIRKDLGRKATALDLADIDTWMKVDEVESEKSAKEPPIP